MRDTQSSQQEQNPRYQVHGTIIGSDGRPLAAQITVWWQRIRRRVELARGNSSRQGAYRVEFQLPEVPAGQVLIVVEALSPELRAPLASLPTPLQPDLEIDVAAQPTDSSEYAITLRAIEQSLDQIRLIDVAETAEHRDISFLAQETGKTTEQIMQVIVAVRLEALYSIPAPVFYSFVRLHVPSSTPSPLLEASHDFTVIDALVRHLAQLIFGVATPAQTQTLQEAVGKNIIGLQFQKQIPAIVERLGSQRSASLLEQPYLIGKASLGQLLSLAKLPDSKQRTFAQALSANSGSMRGFWRTLGDGKHGFTADEASAIERTLSVGAFVKNHAPLLQLLLQRFEQGNYKALSDLAQLSIEDWTKLVEQSGPPPSIDAAGTSSPAEVFAKVIYTRVTRAFPTIALASRIKVGKFVAPADQPVLDQFFRNNYGLELIRHRLPIYLQQQGEKAFTGVPEKQRAALVSNVKRIQRVLLITPEVDAAQKLLELGVHSATEISTGGRQQFFLKATKAGISKRDANRIYSTASHRYAQMISLYTQFHRDAIGIWPKAIGDISALEKPMNDAILRDQSLATLFGSQDYCAVDSCTSILSPAAYLCDLLHWLGQRMTAGQSALAVLNNRRPDIGNLKLNCPNSETPLPYIDLVNEILADAIAPPANPNSTINPPWKQTSEGKSAAELRAAPEYFNQDAYVTLFSANYPHTLPYSEGLDELRAYLGQSNIPLWQLRQALLPIRNVSAAGKGAVAAEKFGISPHEQDLITNANFISAAAAWNTAAPANDLVSVPAFLQGASLTYEGFLELLDVAWVQGTINEKIQGIDDTCDTSIQSLSPAPLDAGWLDRTHRFLRMWRRTGYKMWELDQLLQAPTVANGSLSLAGVTAIFTFRVLQDSTSLAVDQLLAFFQNMDTASHREPDGSTSIPLYSRVFLNPAVISQHPDGDLAAIPSGVAIGDNNLAHHLDAIQAALGISAIDAGNLSTLFGLDAANTLTLQNLSLLYRVIQLASAAHLSITDLGTVALLINPGAGNRAAALTGLFASSDTTLDFLRTTKAVQQSGLSIDTLTYLLTPPIWTTTTGITDAGITAVLEAVRQAILNPSGGDVNGSVTAAVAGQLSIANDIAAFLVQQLKVPGTAQTLITVLTDASLTSQPGGNFLALTRANFPNQFRAVQLLDKVRIIIDQLHLVNSDVSWLLTNAAVYGGIDFAALPVTAAQASLAVGPLLTTVLLVQLTRLFNQAPPVSPIQTLYDLIGGVQAGSIANEALTQASLATISGWNLADITALATGLGISFAQGDYLKPASYDRLRTLEAMIAATAGKAHGDQLVSWAQVPADEPTAESMAASALNVLKARYSNADWLTTAPAIINPIREHRSAALESYLIAKRDMGGNLIYGDVNGLFDHFLIDVQMSSCEVTTRVIQAYIAVQIFVERCRMNLEAPQVQIDAMDDAWEWWRWMKRYRIWEAARQVFLFPENWLIESQRPNRTEIFHKLEQEVHQNDHTADHFEAVGLNYLDRLEEVGHLVVTGTCEDPVSGAIHVVGRTQADPPRYYHRALEKGEWSGWLQVPTDIKAHQVVPAIYRGRLCLFWMDVMVSNEPHQTVPAAQTSTTPPSQDVSRYAAIGLNFTMFRNGTWMPAQKAKGKLFDVPPLRQNIGLYHSPTAIDAKSAEAFYSLKVQTPAPAPNYGASLFIDLFRLGNYQSFSIFNSPAVIVGLDPSVAVHIGRAVFDGRFSDLELRNLEVPGPDVKFDPFLGDFPMGVELLSHAQSTYGADAQSLLPLPGAQADPNLVGEPGLIPKAGALITKPSDPNSGSNQTLPLNFTATALEQNAGVLLSTASVPFRVVGPDSDLGFDPAAYFFYQDNRRCYFVETQKYFWTGSTWAPIPPSNPATAPFEARYFFHRFYHPYTRLMWHQLGSGGFRALYDQKLQLTPDQIDPTHADVFSFQNTYGPLTPRVAWGEDNEILDFAGSAAYGIYNWETFFHIPFYFAQLLMQNQQFEDAQAWFHYLFDPTRQSPDPAPKRFWIPKPLYNLTSTEILNQRINNLLQLVNQGDPDALNQVARWRDDPFNPFLLADLRPVAYMKAVVMAYLDNLIAWADNLFATESREALSEATLLYVIAAEMLGPQPAAIMPPTHADDSYNQLAPKLDAFSNAFVDIENIMGQGGNGGGGGNGGQMPAPQTFYFKIPPNEKLLGYWKTVGNRLFKLRHCQNLQGVTRQLALFDAPIDPGLLIRARAAGVDIGSVLADVQVALPNYRFTALYPQALDFVNAVRAYGALLLAALEKSDAAQLSVMLATNQQQLLSDADQIFAWQVEQAQDAIDALQAAIDLQQSRIDFYGSQSYMNAAEIVDVSLSSAVIAANVAVAIGEAIAAGVHSIPDFVVGAAGFGGTPAAHMKEGGSNFGDTASSGAEVGKATGNALTQGAQLSRQQGNYGHRSDGWGQSKTEAEKSLNQAKAQLAGAQLALEIAQQNQTNHQTQIAQLQQQIDFLTDKFSNQDLYDWMSAQLSDTYFQSYRLAYKLCKQVERCYRYELGIADSNFIQFGYWDNLHKGLLAGESLNHDLRRLQASYLETNVRRFEISRYISLSALNAAALAQLVSTGACDFDLPESLFDHDYPGHYNRHLFRMSVTVAYPSPGKFDNVKATLTLVSNKVRTSADTSSSYAENPVGSDTRFAYNYAAVPQKIVLGNAQDDPGLFLTAVNNNLSDQRYLPFEGAGAISSWHLEVSQANNEITLSKVTDVVLHLYYTSLDGGDGLKQAVANG